MALIPRYLDLLLLLVRRRADAVTRSEIMDAVWSDVVVSDGALSQAVRTLRRALGDDPREPAYIRTVARHGYRFVHADVIEEPDEPAASAPAAAVAVAAADAVGEDPFEPLLDRLLGGPPGPQGDADRRDAAEALHALDTAEALRRLDRRPGHARGLALLRDARWDVPRAGAVPLLRDPQGWRSAAALVSIRLRHVLRMAGERWSAAATGGALAGLLGGVAGAMILLAAPGSQVPAGMTIALGVIGLVVGGIGAAGVGAGLAAAEVLARSARTVALVGCAAVGGAVVGFLFRVVARAGLEALFGLSLARMGGGFEGLLLGAAAGLGYGLAVHPPSGGMATPHGLQRLWAVLATAACCGAAAALIVFAGGELCASSLNNLARSFQGSHVGLAPVARLLGESEMGPVTRCVLGIGEGALFGAGMAMGITRRPHVPGEAALT